MARHSLENADDSSSLSAIHDRIKSRLTGIERDGLMRTMQPPSGIDLSSNDYLSLSTHPLLCEKMAQAALSEGCGSTGSRLLRGDRSAFTQLERRFARFKGAARALYFSSGYLANLAVLTTFAEKGDVIYSDERNHASLIDGIRLSGAERRIFPHNDVDALTRLVDNETAPGQKFIVTESLFSMDGDVAPLANYAAICRRTGAALIVDEAHAVGIYGPTGAGLLEASEVSAFISVDTGGKALGVSGAFVSGPEWAIEYLVQRARPFIFSTAAPPPVAAALDASLTIIESEPWRKELLLSRAGYLRERLRDTGVSVSTDGSHIIPIILGDNRSAVAVAHALQQEGFDVRAIRPPTVPVGTARLRISVNLGLTEPVLDRFVSALAAALKEAALCPACL